MYKTLIAFTSMVGAIAAKLIRAKLWQSSPVDSIALAEIPGLSPSEEHLFSEAKAWPLLIDADARGDANPAKPNGSEKYVETHSHLVSKTTPKTWLSSLFGERVNHLKQYHEASKAIVLMDALDGIGPDGMAGLIHAGDDLVVLGDGKPLRPADLVREWDDATRKRRLTTRYRMLEGEWEGFGSLGRQAWKFVRSKRLDDARIATMMADPRTRQQGRNMMAGIGERPIRYARVRYDSERELREHCTPRQAEMILLNARITMLELTLSNPVPGLGRKYRKEDWAGHDNGVSEQMPEGFITSHERMAEDWKSHGMEWRVEFVPRFGESFDAFTARVWGKLTPRTLEHKRTIGEDGETILTPWVPLGWETAEIPFPIAVPASPRGKGPKPMLHIRNAPLGFLRSQACETRVMGGDHKQEAMAWLRLNNGLDLPQDKRWAEAMQSPFDTDAEGSPYPRRKEVKTTTGCWVSVPQDRISIKGGTTTGSVVEDLWGEWEIVRTDGEDGPMEQRIPKKGKLPLDSAILEEDVQRIGKRIFNWKEMALGTHWCAAEGKVEAMMRDAYLSHGAQVFKPRRWWDLSCYYAAAGEFSTLRDDEFDAPGHRAKAKRNSRDASEGDLSLDPWARGSQFDSEDADDEDKDFESSLEAYGDMLDRLDRKRGVFALPMRWEKERGARLSDKPTMLLAERLDKQVQAYAERMGKRRPSIAKRKEYRAIREAEGATLTIAEVKQRARLLADAEIAERIEAKRRDIAWGWLSTMDAHAEQVLARMETLALAEGGRKRIDRKMLHRDGTSLDAAPHCEDATLTMGKRWDSKLVSEGINAEGWLEREFAPRLVDKGWYEEFLHSAWPNDDSSCLKERLAGGSSRLGAMDAREFLQPDDASEIAWTDCRKTLRLIGIAAKEMLSLLPEAKEWAKGIKQRVEDAERRLSYLGVAERQRLEDGTEAWKAMTQTMDSEARTCYDAELLEQTIAIAAGPKGIERMEAIGVSLHRGVKTLAKTRGVEAKGDEGKRLRREQAAIHKETLGDMVRRARSERRTAPRDARNWRLSGRDEAERGRRTLKAMRAKLWTEPRMTLTEMLAWLDA